MDTLKDKIFDKKGTRKTTTGTEKNISYHTKRKTQAVSLAVMSPLHQAALQRSAKAASIC